LKQTKAPPSNWKRGGKVAACRISSGSGQGRSGVALLKQRDCGFDFWDYEEDERRREFILVDHIHPIIFDDVAREVDHLAGVAKHVRGRNDFLGAGFDGSPEAAELRL
jgi:hypothetical protein